VSASYALQLALCIPIACQVSTQAKISSFKNPQIKIDLLLLPRGAKSP